MKFDTFLLKFNFIVVKQRKNILVFFSYQTDPEQIVGLKIEIYQTTIESL